MSQKSKELRFFKGFMNIIKWEFEEIQFSIKLFAKILQNFKDPDILKASKKYAI